MDVEGPEWIRMDPPNDILALSLGSKISLILLRQKPVDFNSKSDLPVNMPVVH